MIVGGWEKASEDDLEWDKNLFFLDAGEVFSQS